MIYGFWRAVLMERRSGPTTEVAFYTFTRDDASSSYHVGSALFSTTCTQCPCYAKYNNCYAR